jgi:hypothetical protein
MPTRVSRFAVGLPIATLGTGVQTKRVAVAGAVQGAGMAVQLLVKPQLIGWVKA